MVISSKSGGRIRIPEPFYRSIQIHLFSYSLHSFTFCYSVVYKLKNTAAFSPPVAPQDYPSSLRNGFCYYSYLRERCCIYNHVVAVDSWRGWVCFQKADKSSSAFCATGKDTPAFSYNRQPPKLNSPSFPEQATHPANNT